MLSIGKLAAGQQQYYLDTVARGAEEYYTAVKEAPGQWVGHSAERLDLTGEVDADVLHRVLDSRAPVSGTRLTRAQGAPRVPAFDATFCAPKSVSLLFALGAPEVSNEVRNAHDAAVSSAFEVLEVEASRARRGKAGVERVAGEGFVAAAFRHRTSRAGDPHLHTHVLIANLVFSPSDGRWSALDARALYQWAKTAGFLYEAQLRAELTRRLGVEWGPIRHGIADVAGIDQIVLRGFSQRRQDIEAFLDDMGLTSARAAQVATYATRAPKDPEVTPEGLLPEWRARAERLGLDAETLAAVAGRTIDIVAVPAPGDAVTELIFAWLASPGGLTRQASTFGRREILQSLAGALPQGATAREITALADAFLTSEHAIPCGATGLRARDVIRRADGTVVAAYADEARWTTREMLRTEHELVATALERRNAGVGIARHEHVLAALDAHPTLGDEQTRLVWQLTRFGAGVEVIPGAAGTGKTHALGAAREVWEASGHHVLGCALAARAAAQLEASAGIHAVTLHRLLGDLDDPETGGLDVRSVVVIDEAAMVGTRTLARLLAHGERAGAKVVLIGDHHQLPEIAAGGAFAGLAARLNAGSLTGNRRQHAAWELEALEELRTGDTDTALAAYHAHGRIKHGPAGHDIRAELVADWWTARTQGQRAVMLAGTNRNVDDLNQRVRELLRAAGRLGPDQLIVAGHGFAIGDEVLATRNDYHLGVLNGTRATISALDHQKGTIHVRTDAGRVVVFRRDYLEAGHLTHGYATTLHKAQGATVQAAFALADETLSREHAYTALSRGTDRNTLYLTHPSDVRVEERHAREQPTDPLEHARAALRRSVAKTMAIDATPPGALAGLRDERARLRAAIGDQPTDPTRALEDTHRRLEAAEANLEATRTRRQALEDRRDATRGLRRLTCRDQRDGLQTALHEIRARETSNTIGLTDLRAARDKLADQSDRYTTWKHAHQPQLDRLRDIDTGIDTLTARVDREPGHTRSVEVERDAGLGLEL